MPRRKALSAYPKAYFETVETAQSEPVTVPVASYERARLLRNDFYNFRSVLIEEAEVNDAYARLARCAENLTITISNHEGQVKLLFTYYDPEHNEIAETVARRRLEE